MGTKQKYIWLAVTADEYEFPVKIADTAMELAKMCGVNYNTVLTSEYRSEPGKRTGFRYRKVIRDEKVD